MFKTIFQFYLNGFRNMRLGRTLWKIVLLKLLIMFAVIKVLFFPNELKTKYDNDQDRAEHVLQNLTMVQAAVNGPRANTLTPDDSHGSTDPQTEVARD